MSTTGQKENNLNRSRVPDINNADKPEELKPSANHVALNNRRLLLPIPDNTEVSTPSKNDTTITNSTRREKFEKLSKNQEEQKPCLSQQKFSSSNRTESTVTKTEKKIDKSESSSNSDENLASCSKSAGVVKVTQKKSKKRKNKSNRKPVIGNKKQNADVIQNMFEPDVDDQAKVDEEEQREFVFNKPYVFKLPKQQIEAIRGHQHGSFSLPVKIPGIPWKKFGREDLEKHGNSETDWSVQSIYQINDDYYFVYYEGWTAQTGELKRKAAIEKDASEMLKLWETRVKITEAIEKITGEKWFPDVMRLQENAKSSHWILEDLSYYHTLYHVKHNLGELFYMSKRFDIKTYPTYLCIHRNVVDCSIEATLKENPLSMNINTVITKNQNKKFFKKVQIRNNWNPCPSKDCKCDIRKRMVYDKHVGTVEAKRLRYGKDGRLNFGECKVTERRYSIECSDACGCDKDCPTRIVQRGQKYPLVVYYEESIKGYGVRTGCHVRKGDLIAEYTGVIRWHEEVKDQLYSVDCVNFKEGVLIDSSEKGNVARFANHSCNANSMFVETHSRVFESATLVPRVGLFAVKDIPIGEKVTVNYYGKVILKLAAEDKESSIPCLCGTRGCLKWLPTKW